MRDAVSSQQLGIAGFEALETNCASAVPELMGLLEDTNHAFTALRCLVFIGKPAEESVCRALTNGSPKIRSFSTSQLASVTDELDVFLARLKGPLHDQDATVRFAAVQALGLQTQYPTEVIPLLINALDDPYNSVWSSAINSLARFGTNEGKAFEALSNLAATGSVRRASHALGALRAISPERALPMILSKLHSIEPLVRSAAAHALGEYEVATPGIVAALKGAAADSEPNVAGKAKQAMLRLREKGRKNSATKVVFANEPVCDGKKLGQWLEEWRADGTTQAEVQAALRRMGTNAIPALFERLVYRDPVFNLADYQISLGAARGFMLMGEQAASALPKLEELVNGDDDRIALFALVAASNSGTNSLAVLSRAFTNRNEDVRNQATAFLADLQAGLLPDARKKRGR